MTGRARSDGGTLKPPPGPAGPSNTVTVPRLVAGDSDGAGPAKNHGHGHRGGRFRVVIHHQCRTWCPAGYDTTDVAPVG